MSKVSGVVVEHAGKLRFPILLAISAVLFGLDFMIPDAIPFVDEIFLGLSTVILATWRRKKSTEGEGEVIEGVEAEVVGDDSTDEAADASGDD